MGDSFQTRTEKIYDPDFDDDQKQPVEVQITTIESVEKISNVQDHRFSWSILLEQIPSKSAFCIGFVGALCILTFFGLLFLVFQALPFFRQMRL